MIGQNKIREWCEFPHFFVLVAPRYAGKRTVAKFIAHKLSCVYTECEIRVDAVREVIDSSYQSHTNVLYCFADADNMRPEAKNAMLKITEEPPKNAYFCLTVYDSGTLLETIKSRAYVFYLEPYTQAELKEYFSLKWEGQTDKEILWSAGSTPGEINMLVEYGKDFLEYVDLVIDNIAEVEPANAFKSCGKLNLKNEEGYDLALFWRVFMVLCEARYDDNLDNCDRIAKGISVTAEHLNKVYKLGVNKQQLYDDWVFEIRKVWL